MKSKGKRDWRSWFT